jgi:hypothetical protein
MSKISKRTSIVMPSVAEDKIITAAAKSDPDAQPLTPTQLKTSAQSSHLIAPIGKLGWV